MVRRSRMRFLPMVAAAAVAVTALAGCGAEHHDYVAVATDPEKVPTMTTRDVETFVSDSGYIRYRITTPLWQMFEDARDPYWLFPGGLELQQFDNFHRPQANVVCDSAIFYSARGLWILTGHVVAVNTEADSFVTEQLYWNRAGRTVYSDSFVHIVRTDHILEGYGFESDETMSAYRLNRPTGIIPIEQAQRRGAAPRDTATDSVASAPVSPTRPRPRRA